MSCQNNLFCGSYEPRPYKTCLCHMQTINMLIWLCRDTDQPVHLLYISLISILVIFCPDSLKPIVKVGRHKGIWSSETSITRFWSSSYWTLVIRHCIHNWKKRYKRDLDAKFEWTFDYQPFAHKNLFSFPFSCMSFILVCHIITEYKGPKVKRDHQCLLSLCVYSSIFQYRHISW